MARLRQVRAAWLVKEGLKRTDYYILGPIGDLNAYFPRGDEEDDLAEEADVDPE